MHILSIIVQRYCRACVRTRTALWEHIIRDYCLVEVRNVFWKTEIRQTTFPHRLTTVAFHEIGDNVVISRLFAVSARRRPIESDPTAAAPSCSIGAGVISGEVTKACAVLLYPWFIRMSLRRTNRPAYSFLFFLFLTSNKNSYRRKNGFWLIDS